MRDRIPNAEGRPLRNLAPVVRRGGAVALAGRRPRHRQDLRRVGALAQPRDRAPAAAATACGRWRELHDRAGTDAGAGRRIRMRQEHGGARAGGALPPEPRPCPLCRQGRACHAGLGAGQGAAPAHPDDLPGPVREPEPTLEGRGHRRRAAARTWPGNGEGRAARSRWRTAAVGGAESSRHGQVPAPVLRRPAPAHLDRARAGDRAGVPGLRRADLGARRQRAGAGAQHHEGPAARAGLDLSLHLAQPGGGAPCERPGRRDVPGPAGGGGGQGAAVRDAAASVHPHAARCDPADACHRPRAHAGAGRGAEPAVTTDRLRLPSALSACECAVLGGAADAAALRGNPGGLPRGGGAGADLARRSRATIVPTCCPSRRYCSSPQAKPSRAIIALDALGPQVPAA